MLEVVKDWLVDMLELVSVLEVLLVIEVAVLFVAELCVVVVLIRVDAVDVELFRVVDVDELVKDCVVDVVGPVVDVVDILEEPMVDVPLAVWGKPYAEPGSRLPAERRKSRGKGINKQWT